MASELYAETGAASVEIINETDVETSLVMAEIGTQVEAEIAALTRWTNETRRTRAGGIFDRDTYLTPDCVFDQFRTAKRAVESDDVVGGVVESTESLAFAKMSIEAEDEDEEDVWNQIAADLDMDSRLREQWRETFTVSQCYTAIWWGTKSYKVGGRTEAGVARRKTYDNLTVPVGVSVLDPLKVVPVGNFMFNQERLAYVADRGETDIINDVLSGRRATDRVIAQLMIGPYEPGESERRELGDAGIPADRLYLMNPLNVWRHTDTRAQYERFATVRLKGVFELLDLKHQLRAMDRAHLIGGTNFIVLIRKGTDQHPAVPAETQQLRAQVRTLARLPVLVGDHRLSVEIVTPNTDFTLNEERYDNLDSRIRGRLFQMFMNGAGDDSIKLARVVARGLESRRHQLRRSWEKNILQTTYAKNDVFKSMPKLRFHPKRVALDLDPAYVNFLLDLRDRGDLSRETILEEADFSQANEARRRKIEKARYDGIFETVVPGAPIPRNSNAPTAPADPKAAGRRTGGIKNGGGAAPGTGQGQPATDPRKKSDGGKA